MAVAASFFRSARFINFVTFPASMLLTGVSPTKILTTEVCHSRDILLSYVLPRSKPLNPVLLLSLGAHGLNDLKLHADKLELSDRDLPGYMRILHILERYLSEGIEYLLVDGTHRSFAAALTGRNIAAVVAETDEDIVGYKDMVLRLPRVLASNPSPSYLYARLIRFAHSSRAEIRTVSEQAKIFIN